MIEQPIESPAAGDEPPPPPAHHRPLAAARPTSSVSTSGSSFSFLVPGGPQLDSRTLSLFRSAYASDGARSSVSHRSLLSSPRRDEQPHPPPAAAGRWAPPAGEQWMRESTALLGVGHHALRLLDESVPGPVLIVCQPLLRPALLGNGLRGGIERERGREVRRGARGGALSNTPLTAAMKNTPERRNAAPSQPTHERVIACVALKRAFPPPPTPPFIAGRAVS